MKRLVIVGAGGFGREVFSIIHDINQVQETWDVLGFLDDNPGAIGGSSLYPPVLGPAEHCGTLPDAWAICAVGNPKIRMQLVQRANAHGARWASIVHPTVQIGLGSSFGIGCVLCQQAIVTTDARIGDHVHVNCMGHVTHDTRVGDFSTISSHVEICGHGVLEEGVFLGTHAAILPGIRVGAWASVGAGSAAMTNVAPGHTVLGVPAKSILTRGPATDVPPPHSDCTERILAESNR
jgi:sugar O-acyltransferase (sialic acid O-acetyltransferase NeuD family)